MGAFLLTLSALSLSYKIVLLINWIGACFALTVNFLAFNSARKQKVGRRTGLVIYSSISIMSLIYVVAFLMLFVGPWSLVGWSTVMSYVSILVWPFIWSLPALMRPLARQSMLDVAVDQIARETRKHTVTE